MDPVYIIECGSRCDTYGSDFYGSMFVAFLIPVLLLTLFLCSPRCPDMPLPKTAAGGT